LGECTCFAPLFLYSALMISDWEMQIKSQIKRRYAQQAATQSYDTNKLKNSGYPSDLIKKIPLNFAAQYSGCGYLFKDINFDGSETVLDLGSGSGVDSYIASIFLDTGKVFSIDMTFEMLSNYNIHNIKPICADIEYLPTRDSRIDMIIANASFNLSINKEKAFGEAFRVLKENGRLIMRDIIIVADLPQEVLTDPLSFNTSLGGALDEKNLRSEMESVGFVDITISDHKPFSYVASVKIEAKKPLKY
jgi:arsenite methyltransferase